MLECKGERRSQISKLAAAVIGLPVILDGVEVLVGHLPRHGIGQLNFAASALGLVGKVAKHGGLQDVATGNRKVRGGGADRWLLDHSAHADADKPDLVMVESAWAGNQGSWHYRIAKYNRSMGEELRDMLAVADEAKVPSVFWNKEDPVHFERFIDSAKKCDVILTTDDQCVPRYIAESGKNRVDAMPFAAQPAIHNPLGSESRLNNPCFAGTYYGSRHQQRGADMMHLLKPAVDFDLHIYDRRYGYAGKDADQFRFPDIFQPCIQGKLAYDEMTRAYKRYRSFLNVNSVTTSQTMFSR